MQEALNKWMAGEQFYDYSAGGCKEMDTCPFLSKGQKVIGKEGISLDCCWPFAHVVWKSSKKLGIGQAQPKGKPYWNYIVVQYQPGVISSKTTPEEFKARLFLTFMLSS